MAVTIALVTDTHVRPPYDDGQAAFPSDHHHNERNRAAAEVVRALAPAAVVHLGDVVHPIPTLPSHADALAIAKAIWTDCGAPLAVVPGNHDVGDKRASINAPTLAAEARAAFTACWGPTYRSLDVDGVHLVIVDGGLLAQDTPEAAAQRAWLEADLAAAGRTFVFTHYPPFLTDPDEPEHYDNLPPDARHWLLDRLVAHGVDALFSGHVHRFFVNRFRGVDLVTVPSLAFVRPEYAWLRPNPPADAEHGRDDDAHLGLARLVVEADGYRLDVHRPATGGWPAPRRPLGTWLRHRLGRRAELPYGDLDALTRKTARDDAGLLAVRDLGFGRVRVPLADLVDPDVRVRLDQLRRDGVRVSVFSGGLPSEAQRRQVEGFGPAEWEVVVRPADVEALVGQLQEWSGPPLTIGRIGRPWSPEPPPAYFSHFPREGFHPDDPAVAAVATVAGRIAFRIADDGDVEAQVAAACARADGLGVGATCHVELPFAAEAVRQIDDDAVTARVLAADRAARAHPTAHVLLDLLFDKDRGYHPRNGLVDGTDRPRAAYLALKNA